jgi:hypothetical protein
MLRRCEEKWGWKRKINEKKLSLLKKICSKDKQDAKGLIREADMR